MMAFLVLPTLDPVSAAVAYLGVLLIPSGIQMYDQQKRVSDHKYQQRRKWKFLIIFVIGCILQTSGIIIVVNILSEGIWYEPFLYVIASLFSSIKYWENYIKMGDSKSENPLMKLKRGQD